MKIHPVLAVIIGIISTIIMTISYINIGIPGYFPWIIALFLSGVITINISKLNSKWLGFSVGLIISFLILIFAGLNNVFGFNYFLILFPFISGIGGLIRTKK